MENGEQVLVTDSPYILNNKLVGIFDTPDGLLLLTQESESFLLDRTGYFHMDQRFLFTKSDRIYTAIQLKNGSFLLGTVSNGAYHVSSQGEVISHINNVMDYSIIRYCHLWKTLMAIYGWV